MKGRKQRQVLVAAGPVEPEAASRDLATFDADRRGEWWWRQPRWSKRAWRLEVDGVGVAELAGESLFSSLSHVRFAHAEYEVHRGWTGNAELRGEDGDEPRARFRARWTGDGRIEAPNGDALELVATGFWKRTWELRTADELPLARFAVHDAFVRQEAQVLLDDGARRRPDLAELLALASALVFAPKRNST